MKQIQSDTIARTICLVLAMLNQILAVTGKEKIPFVENDIYQICSLLLTFITSIVAWWKNNSFTPAAIAADKLLKQEKMKQKLNK